MADPLTPLSVCMMRSAWSIGESHWMICRVMRVSRENAEQTTEHAAIAFDNAIASLIVPLLHEEAEYLGTWCFRIFPSPVSTDLGFHLGTYTSDRGGDQMPAQVCARLSLFSPAAARRRPSYVYLSQLSEDDVVGDTLSDEWLADAADLGVALSTDQHVVTGPDGDGLTIRSVCPGSPPLPLTSHNAFEWSAECKTQRRRGANGKSVLAPYFPDVIFP